MRELSHEKRKLSKRWVIHRLRSFFLHCFASPSVFCDKGKRSINKKCIVHVETLYISKISFSLNILWDSGNILYATRPDK